MNKIIEYLLKGSRKFYNWLLNSNRNYSVGEHNPDVASEMIFNLLSKDRPCMIARFGANEMTCVANYVGVSAEQKSIIDYIRGRQHQWWWNSNMVNQMKNNAGFFPPTENNLSKFSRMMLEDVNEVDILGSWLADEDEIMKHNDHFRKISLLALEPYWAKEPWSRVLEGKRIVVVHPFKDDIIHQYRKREKLFKDKRVLPQFASLRVVKAVQSKGGNNDHGFISWFEALEWMKREMDTEPYDIALIGCGAYGFPLAAHAKRTGHKSVHLGGALQLMFGIKGRRWEIPLYGYDFTGRLNSYKDFFNDDWIYPNQDTIPLDVVLEEDNGSYWK